MSSDSDGYLVLRRRWAAMGSGTGALMGREGKGRGGHQFSCCCESAGRRGRMQFPWIERVQISLRLLSSLHPLPIPNEGNVGIPPSLPGLPHISVLPTGPASCSSPPRQWNTQRSPCSSNGAGAIAVSFGKGVTLLLQGKPFWHCCPVASSASWALGRACSGSRILLCQSRGLAWLPAATRCLTSARIASPSRKLLVV